MDRLSELPFYFEDSLDTPIRDSYLPQELWDEIFKLLRNRKRALTNAVFVCKRWRDLVLPYLYAVVTVDLWRQPKSFEAFFDFIRHDTTIAGYVKELHLAGSPTVEGASDFDVEIFLPILLTLTSLHTLSIKHVLLRMPDCTSQVPATDSWSSFSLRKLTVSGCRSVQVIGHLDTFAYFFSLFCVDTLEVEELLIPGIVSLQVLQSQMATWHPERHILTNDLVVGPGTFLHGHRWTVIDIHGFFARLLRPGTLRAASSALHDYSSPMVSQFHEFLRSSPAQKIVSINLHLIWVLSWFPRQETIEAVGRAIAACEGLRYLRLEIPGRVRGRMDDPPLRSVLTTILRMAPPTIRAVAVRMITPLWKTNLLELWDLPAIDDLLAPGSTSLFPSLQSVTVELWCTRQKALEEAILSILPRLRAAGLFGVIYATAPLEQGVFMPAL